MARELESFRRFAKEFEAIAAGEKAVSDEQFNLIISGLEASVCAVIWQRVAKTLGTLGPKK
ncbi:hypothetical protein [Enterovibrio norvegicus]|uniref:hypothetical protein n=1 Tax=Enterovibrio norvegicus TaxID=188144 RepID=UPI000C84D4B4|nr:hypothetical protein [Enterovibrio norvegicus]PMN73172.1 hypothetical protein BCT27_12580 [Enterovibrio norvegicus]